MTVQDPARSLRTTPSGVHTVDGCRAEFERGRTRRRLAARLAAGVCKVTRQMSLFTTQLLCWIVAGAAILTILARFRSRRLRALLDRSLDGNKDIQRREVVEGAEPRWRSKFPELDRFTSTEDEQVAWARASRLAFQPVDFVILSIILFVPAFGVFLWRSGWGQISYVMITATIIAEIGAGLFATLVVPLVSRGVMRRSLRRSLNGCGIPTCIGCGYDLTGNMSGTCPECGRRPEAAR